MQVRIFNKNKLVFTGNTGEVSYDVSFIPADNGIWFWQINLSGSNKTADIIYAQDVGVANKGGMQANELYMSQYLDHKIIKAANGYTVSSRQNQPQNGEFPYLQQGSLDTEIVGFSTDATQFFGNDYRKTYTPKALTGNLPNVNYQFELAYIALQTTKFILTGSKTIVFYGIFKPNYPTAVTTLLYQNELSEAYEKVKNKLDYVTEIRKATLKNTFRKPFVSEEFSQMEIEKYFPNRRFAEIEQNSLLSFFTPEHTHVVLQQKEILVEHPHGHIITTKMDDKKVVDGLITSTNYMYFNSQVVVGNTSFHKLLSASRGFLNILKNSGQRIYLKLDGVYRILTLPAAYELGINFAKWYYKVGNDTLIITSFAVADQPEIVLDVTSQNGEKYDYIITNQLVMGEHEFINPVNVLQVNNILYIAKAEKNPDYEPYPNLNYKIHIIGTNYTFSDDGIFYTDGKTRNGTMLTIAVENSQNFQLVIEGSLDTSEITPISKKCLGEEYEKYCKFYRNLFSNFSLSLDSSDQGEIDKLNETIWWYTHNAMTHFAVPHGLEQPGGAAWGTRDVCQGPIEYFLMTEHYELIRDILIKIFEHQFIESKEWPQWFMFDKYDMQADEWHGDIVFWPLKCIGDYIKATNDISILYEIATYRHLADSSITTESSSIFDHIKEAVETVKARFLYDTALISYAGGDWDDTLQPANKAMKDKLVSAWTVSLAYQVIKQLAEVCSNDDYDYAKELSDMTVKIRESFNKILIKDGVIAGFAYFEDENTINYMLHPDDDKTGIKYRLLPLTRSIIAELVDPEQANKNLSIIDEKLTFPDGVRLMDRPAHYEGGVSTYFQRAEQAANIGREISLQYVHSHIRFIEAMAKLGKSDKAWSGLFTVNPINIKEVVPNAGLRQSNTYFSSSDGAFNTRYEYQDNFEKLRTGTIDVKGGWRIYSSGPGIYLHQLISNVLGTRFTADSLIIDPVLPDKLDGMHFNYTYCGKKVTFVYHINSSNTDTRIVCSGNEVETSKLNNPYRNSGVSVEQKLMLSMLENSSTIDIYTK